MKSNPLILPPEGVEAEVLADWLEMAAFFSRFGKASVDDIIAAFELQSEDPEEDIAERDRAEEALREQIEEELSFRSRSLGGAYPFALSEDGEELTFENFEDELDAGTSYLVCLILSHITNSPILRSPPNPAMTANVRKHLFQIISTLAAAGHANGGAASLGWPRTKKESIIDVVRRASDCSQTGTARDEPNGLAPPRAKDGGLDVLAWTLPQDGPPATVFWFVQAASGENWIEKSAKADYDKFLYCYYDAKPECNHNFLTVCPFRVPQEVKQYQQLEHGAVSDRTRVPAMVKAAIEASAKGREGIDEIERFQILGKWLSRYRRETLSAA